MEVLVSILVLILVLILLWIAYKEWKRSEELKMQFLGVHEFAFYLLSTRVLWGGSSKGFFVGDWNFAIGEIHVNCTGEKKNKPCAYAFVPTNLHLLHYWAWKSRGIATTWWSNAKWTFFFIFLFSPIFSSSAEMLCMTLCRHLRLDSKSFGRSTFCSCHVAITTLIIIIE